MHKTVLSSGLRKPPFAHIFPKSSFFAHHLFEFEVACVFVLDLNSCVKTRTGTWALTLQKRVGGEQVHEDYYYNVHKMDQLLSHATVK